jgi:adenylate cyclase
MSYEIERKYLVSNEILTLLEESSGTTIKQGYLVKNDSFNLRVRIKGEKGFLTLKTSGAKLFRTEFEYPIPKSDAEYMLNTLNSVITKKRYGVMHGDKLWEIDIFSGQHDGLVIAEVEISHEDEVILLPSWIIEEVTEDPRFYNQNLV